MQKLGPLASACRVCDLLFLPGHQPEENHAQERWDNKLASPYLHMWARLYGKSGWHDTLDPYTAGAVAAPLLGLSLESQRVGYDHLARILARNPDDLGW